MNPDPSASPAPLRLPLAAAEIVDGACDAFEAAWRLGGPRPRIEDHWCTTEEATRSAMLVELVAAELELHQAAGERPEPGEYLDRFPGFAAILAALFDATDPDSEPGAARTASRRVPTIPGYVIVDELGRGGMGVVYLARQQRLGRTVALKMILAAEDDSTEAVARFLAEARLIARIKHPHIVEIYQVGDHDGRPFIELEYVAGGSLADRLRGTPWPAIAAAGLIRSIAAGIGAAHRLGVVHRDLKPANILLTDDGTPKITDFGLAKGIGPRPA